MAKVSLWLRATYSSLSDVVTSNPEVLSRKLHVLDHPELVKSLHEEYVHSGSDVVLAFTVIFIFCKIDFKKSSTFHEFVLIKAIFILFIL